MKGRAFQVHILPIGWEFDRAVLPFKAELKDPRRQHANRVHLVVPDPPGGLGFPERVEKALKKLGLEVKLHPIAKMKDGKSIEFGCAIRAEFPANLVDGRPLSKDLR